MNNDENKNLDIDSLLDDVLADDSTLQEFENTRIKSPKEIAQKELFADKATTVDLEQIDENLGIKPKNKSQKDADEKTSAVQESLDLSSAPKTFYKNEESNDKNYKKLLSKLIKNTDVVTSEFVSNIADESGLIEDGKDPSGDASTRPYPIAAEVDAKEQPKENTISVRNYSPKTAVDDKSDYIYINKALFATLGSVSALALIETLIMYFVINSINPIHRVFYYIAALVAIIPLGFGVFIYAFAPNKAVNRKFSYITYLLNSLIITVLLAVLLIVIVLLTSVSLTDPVDYVPKVIIPTLFILDYPIGVGFYALYTKTSLFRLGK